MIQSEVNLGSIMWRLRSGYSEPILIKGLERNGETQTGREICLAIHEL
jgi:hypothetical protein